MSQNLGIFGWWNSNQSCWLKYIWLRIGIKSKSRDCMIKDIQEEEYVCGNREISVRHRWKMEDILFQQIRSIWYPPQACQFLKIIHHIHSNYEKTSLKELCSSISRIEPKNVLTTTTTFHVEDRGILN